LYTQLAKAPRFRGHGEDMDQEQGGFKVRLPDRCPKFADRSRKLSQIGAGNLAKKVILPTK